MALPRAVLVSVSGLVLYSVVLVALLSAFFATDKHKPALPTSPRRSTMLRPKFLLFGDSITQKSFSVGGWGAAVTDAYQRKADVLNRGYSGYNSRWALQLLDRVLPQEMAGDIALSTVFFGANDAALPDRTSARQYVPLAEYEANIRTIVERLRKLQVPSIVLITPPPISEPHRIAHAAKQFNINLEFSERTNEVTGQYARACVALAAELGVPSLDLWTAFQSLPGWQDGLLDDGLHLTQAGNQQVASLLLSLIEREFPHLRPAEMADDAPLNNDINPGDPESTFREFYLGKETKAA